MNNAGHDHDPRQGQENKNNSANARQAGFG